MWSWLLMAVGVTGMWVAGRRPKVGWLIGLSAQGLWVAYAVATSQLGFLVSAGVYSFVYASNWLHAWRSRASELPGQERTDDTVYLRRSSTDCQG